MPSDKEKHDTKILAVAGKGGVGKTSIAASIVRLLAENHPDSRILAIDADPGHRRGSCGGAVHGSGH